MKYTSAEANKMLKKLNNDYRTIASLEHAGMSFLAATGEDPDKVRPAYDYEETQAKLAEITDKIRTVKHAINLFNATTKVPGTGMTVDELLVVMPLLSDRIRVLDGMRSTLPMVRERSYGSGTNATIDYRYTNYDIAKAEADYAEAADRLARLQNALDLLNNTEKFEIDI
ncbi:MAG: hypothetical protein IJM17_03010 [Firmicutes bacterium]|nr:hypothetical protein [Bacillota bacterium]